MDYLQVGKTSFNLTAIKRMDEKSLEKFLSGLDAKTQKEVKKHLPKKEKVKKVEK